MSARRAMNGWLKKRPNKGNIGQAHRRWFVMESPILSWYTSELEHDQKGFATLTKYSSVAQLPRGNGLGPNFEVTANSEQIFIAEAASPEQATEWVLCINDCIKQLRGQAGTPRDGGGAAGDMEKKLMEQAMAETRRMEQMQAQHRLRHESSAASEAEKVALANEARAAKQNAMTAAEQLEEQSAVHQAELEALQAELEAQQNESLQTMETTLVEMEEMQGKLDAAQARIAELEASGGGGGVSAEELELAVAETQEENRVAMEKQAAAHAAQVDKMTKERVILIREVKKLQKAVKDAAEKSANAAADGAADPAEVQALRDELADKDALLAQQGEEIEALISMQAEQEAATDAKVAEALEAADAAHAEDIQARGEEMQAALQRQSDGFNVERAGHQAQLEQLRADHTSVRESMQRQLDALQQTGSSQSIRAQQAIAAEKAMQDAMMEYDDRLRESQAKMEAQVAELADAKGQLEALQAEKQGAEDAAADAAASADEARARAAELEAAAAGVAQEHAAAMEAVLQGQAEDAKHFETAAAEAAAGRAAAEQGAEALRGEVAQLQAAAAEATAAAEAAEAGASEQTQAQVGTLEREVANLNDHLNRAEAELDAAQQALAEAKKQHAEKEDAAISREMDLKARLDEAAAAAQAEAGSEAARIESEMELTGKVEAAAAAAAAAEAKLAAAEQRAADLQREHAAEVSRLEAAAAAAAAKAAASAAAATSGELEARQEEAIYQAIQGVQEEHAAATAQREAEFTEQLAEAQARVRAAEEAAERSRLQANELEAAFADAQQALDGARSQTAQAEAAAAAGRAHATAAAEALATSEAKVQQLEQQVLAAQADAVAAAAAAAAAEQKATEAESAAAAAAPAAAAAAAATATATEDNSGGGGGGDGGDVRVQELQAELERERVAAKEAAAQAAAAEAALAEVSAEAAAAKEAAAVGAAAAGGFTQADVDAAVAREVAAKEAAHQKELMTVRIQAAKRLAASSSPRAASANSGGGGNDNNDNIVVDAEPAAAAAAAGSPAAAAAADAAELEALRKEVATLKEGAAKVAGVRQREKLVLVQEIRRNRTTLEERDAAINELEAAAAAAKADVQAKQAELEEARAAAAAAATRVVPPDPNAGRLTALSKDLSTQLDAATARADMAQSTIELQHAEIKRLKARVAALEAELKRKDADLKAALEEAADAASSASPSNPPRAAVSPALRRVKSQATNGGASSTRSLRSESSFASSHFDTDSQATDDEDESNEDDDDDDDDSNFARSPGVDSPRTRLAPKGAEPANNANYAADNEGASTDSDEGGGGNDHNNNTNNQSDGGDVAETEDERMADLEDEMVNFLHDHGFGAFEAGVLDLGVEMMDDLKLLGPEDLEDIGMAPAQVEAFMFTVGSRFKVGQRIRIVNLTKAQVFNGLTGYVMDPIKDARYTIKLDRPPQGSSQTLVSCYPTNLVKVDGPGPADNGSTAAAAAAAPAPGSAAAAAAAAADGGPVTGVGSGTMVSRDQPSPRRSAPQNADQKSRLISDAVSPSDTIKMVRNPGTFSRTTSGSDQLVALSHTEWTEVDCADHPPPRCSLESPLIQQILQSWTRSSERLDKMNAWLRAIMRGAFNDPDFSWGIEIAELTPEVANGFLTVLLPLVVIRAPMLINVYVRLSHPPEDRHYQPTIDLRLSLNGWQQVDCSMNPAPKCDVLSPLIQNLLECWTSNRDRLRRMNDWLQTVMVGRFDDENFMDGIEMLELAPEIVQGFLTMLVPLIQARAPVKVKVYLRQALKSAYITLQQKNQNLLDLLEPENSDGVIMDLRLSVTPRDYHYTP